MEGIINLNHFIHLNSPQNLSSLDTKIHHMHERSYGNCDPHSVNYCEACHTLTVITSIEMLNYATSFIMLVF